MKKIFTLFPLVIALVVFSWLSIQLSQGSSDVEVSLAKDNVNENNIIQPKPDNTGEPVYDGSSPDQLENDENGEIVISNNSSPSQATTAITNQNRSEKNLEYTLEGQGCDESTIPSSCDLILEQNTILNLKKCENVEVNTNCNLYSYSLQKQTADKVYIFKEYTDSRGVDLLEIIEFDTGQNESKIIESVINDSQLPESVQDYNSAYNSYKK